MLYHMPIVISYIIIIMAFAAHILIKKSQPLLLRAFEAVLCYLSYRGIIWLVFLISSLIFLFQLFVPIQGILLAHASMPAFDNGINFSILSSR